MFFIGISSFIRIIVVYVRYFHCKCTQFSSHSLCDKKCIKCKSAFYPATTGWRTNCRVALRVHVCVKMYKM